MLGCFQNLEFSEISSNQNDKKVQRYDFRLLKNKSYKNLEMQTRNLQKKNNLFHRFNLPCEYQHITIEGS